MPDKTKLPALEDYQAPWEKAGTEIDPAEAKKFIHSLLGQIENKEQGEADTKIKLAAATARADAAELLAGNYEKRLNTPGGNDSEELAAAKQRALDLQKQIDTFDVKKDPAYIRLEVANEKGLDAFEAGRLVGSTREELAADADLFLERRPKVDDTKQEEEKPADDGLRSGPEKSRVSTPLGGGSTALGGNEWSKEEMAQLQMNDPFSFG